MRKLFFILSLVTGSVCLNAQSFDNTVQNAFLISRMADKFHIQPRPLDDDLSIRVYSGLLDELDGERIFFLQEDIKKLTVWRLQLDDEIRNKQSGFLSQITGIYRQRLQQADTMIDHIAREPFTLEEVDNYNKTIKDVNGSVNTFNQLNNKVNNGRTQALNNWQETEKKFADDHMPHYH